MVTTMQSMMYLLSLMKNNGASTHHASQATYATKSNKSKYTIRQAKIASGGHQPVIVVLA